MGGDVIGVVGLGAMGLGIAQVYAQAGFRVRATDSQAETRGSALGRLRAGLAPRVAAGKLSAAALAETLSNITVVDAPQDIGAVTMIVEAIVEDMAAKQALWAGLEPTVGPDCVLATNTSALSVTGMAQRLIHPERLLGLHFFNPAPVMRLVELAGHAGSAPAALTTARRVTEAAGKTVIACADRPGFVVNRCARPFYGEALALLEQGRSASDIDAAMLAAGYLIGPLALIDLVGADINLAATEGLARAMGHHPRYHVFAALRAQVAKGDLGRKSGRGLLWPDPPGPAPADAPDIAARIVAVLINEAATLLAEGSVSAPDIDTAMKLGLNFPRGPFEMLRQRCGAAVLATLQALSDAAPAGLRGRYDPADGLKDLT